MKSALIIDKIDPRCNIPPFAETIIKLAYIHYSRKTISQIVNLKKKKLGGPSKPK